ncbi:hypothetical protein L6452_38261 [Arctium lappa]|uniref:Uncharacterized protein n=1 Tax=Arctium lappa TaxID=4217 RepID=A0ACB8Y5Y8_ARCLA|nr:hypothetical protein L6452_38261 [Arctium lappa]
MPKHVAVVMDGNRRWARSQGLMHAAGYLAGVGALKAVVDLCSKWGIQILTVFAFSSDNWLRPKVEVDFLMKLLETVLKDEVAYMLRRYRVNFLAEHNLIIWTTCLGKIAFS